jgi:hypothetical protein
MEGVAETSGYIDEVLDIQTGSIDDTITAGRLSISVFMAQSRLPQSFT